MDKTNNTQGVDAGAWDEREAFDIALDALSDYQNNWDTGLVQPYAESERIAMECAVEAVREALTEARAALSEKGEAAEPVAWRIDPGAGSAIDRFQQVEPYAWQYDEVEKRGGSITPLYERPAPPAAIAEREALTKADMIELYYIAREKPKSEWMYIVRAALAKRRNDGDTTSDKEPK